MEHRRIYTQWMVVEDFNGDVKPDLAVGNVGSNNVSVLLGKGGGTFLPPVSYPVFGGAFSLALAGFNSD